jgi:hypothetical protein
VTQVADQIGGSSRVSVHDRRAHASAELRYNLIGHNCEHMAIMCAIGSWAESYQIRRAFGANAAITAAFLLWFANRSRRNLPIPGWVPKVAIAAALLSVIAIGTYNHQIKKLWAEIRGDWDAHERMLVEDRATVGSYRPDSRTFLAAGPSAAR